MFEAIDEIPEGVLFGEGRNVEVHYLQAEVELIHYKKGKHRPSTGSTEGWRDRVIREEEQRREDLMARGCVFPVHPSGEGWRDRVIREEQQRRDKLDGPINDGFC